MTTTTTEETKTVATPGMALTREAGKFLTFKLADEEYGLEILKVREIIGMINITGVPQMPPFMKGVINLRGKTISVIDLRIKFGLPEIERTEQTCIIVVDVGQEVGILVDTVSEVLDIDGEQIDPPPTISGDVDTSFILGMGKIGDGVKILLNIEHVLSSAELTEIDAVAGADCEPPLSETATTSAGAQSDAPTARRGEVLCED